MGGTSQLIENLDVTQKVEGVEKTWEDGFWDGQDSLNKPLHPLYWKLPINWKPYERGYWFGREMAMIERDKK